MKAECINAEDWGQGKLTKGKVYEITLNAAGNIASFIDDNGLKVSGYLTRFRILQDTPTGKVKQETDKEDRADWRAWRDASLPDGYCPCGISKTMCGYHK